MTNEMTNEMKRRRRNLAMLAVLGGMALLFYAVSFVRMPGL